MENSATPAPFRLVDWDVVETALRIAAGVHRQSDCPNMAASCERFADQIATTGSLQINR